MDFERQYREFFDLTNDAQAAATMCLTVAMCRVANNVAGLDKDRLEHNICMGIRHGLFGTPASDQSNLGRSIQAVADAIGSHREAATPAPA